jgi:hypothetical protein
MIVARGLLLGRWLKISNVSFKKRNWVHQKKRKFLFPALAGTDFLIA